MRERFARFLCRHFHRAITRPVNGEYICLRCQRRFEAFRTMPEFTAKPTPPFNRGGLGGSRVSPNEATGLPGPIAGVLVSGVDFANSPDESAVWEWGADGYLRVWSNGEVAELERLLSLDRPKRVE